MSEQHANSRDMSNEPDSNLRSRLIRGGSKSIIIRSLSAVLAYVMLVVVSRSMPENEFGLFGFAYSIASFAAVLAGLGQSTLVQRFLPIYDHDDRPLARKGLIRDSQLTVLGGGLLVGGIMVALGHFFDWPANTQLPYLIATAALLIGMAMARLLSCILRAEGRIVLGLAPYDVFWRAGVIALVFVVIFPDAPLSATGALTLCAGVLALALMIQMALHPATRPNQFFARGLQTERKLWRHESTGMWGVAILQAAGANLSVVILGLVLSPGETGPLFASLRTANMLSLPMVAGAIVGAPMISRYYRAGKTAEVQRIASYLVIGVAAPVLLGFMAFVLLGDRVLMIFDEGFGSAQPLLVVIAVGTLFNALAGPTGFIMNMTGHHRQYFTIMAITQILSLALLPILVLWLGAIGAAIAIALGKISWNVWVWLWSRAHLKVDPTIVGVIPRLRPARTRTT